MTLLTLFYCFFYTLKIMLDKKALMLFLLMEQKLKKLFELKLKVENVLLFTIYEWTRTEAELKCRGKKERIWFSPQVFEQLYPCSFFIHCIDHLQNKNPIWIGQRTKFLCDKNHIHLFLMKSEATYWWISLYCHLLYQALQLISACNNNMIMARTTL